MVARLESVDLLIVGAGISGLGFAKMAKRLGYKPRVLEASEHIGGAIHTARFKTDQGDYWAELGAHTCYNSYGHFLQLLEESDQLDTLIAKQKLRYQMLIDGHLCSIPSQLNFFELLGVLPRLWMKRKEGRTAEDYFAAVLGRRNFQNVLGPALDAVVCQPAGEFPAESLFRKKPRRKEILRSYTGPLGLQSFIEGMLGDLDIRLNSPVTGIERREAGFDVYTGDAPVVHADKLVLAIAPDVVARLLAQSLPELAAVLAEIEMVDIESQAVRVDTNTLSLPPLAGIIARENAFFSAVSRDTVSDSAYRGFTFHFRPGRLDEAGRLACIAEVLGIPEDRILDSRYQTNRLPALRLGQDQRIAWIDQTLKGMPLGLTGNWFSGVSIEDSLIRSYQECQRLLAG
ncbi:MAG: FAD-dependent oxidoreductase [Candidatus Thiodiazotropha sp.]